MEELILPDGRVLAYREAGTGRPLVLLHGWSMSSAVFSEMIEELSAGFRVLALDLPGHGASTPGELSMAALGEDLMNWLEALAISKPLLLGWSLGGMLALYHASKFPHRIERLLLVGTTPRFVNTSDWAAGLPAGQVRAMGRDLSRNYEMTMTAFFQLMFNKEELPLSRRKEIAKFAVRQGRLPEPQVAAQGLELLQGIDMRGQLQQVACPTLIEHGALDVITPLAAGRYLASAIPGAQLVAYSDCGHAPFLSSPQRSLEQWRTFCA